MSKNKLTLGKLVSANQLLTNFPEAMINFLKCFVFYKHSLKHKDYQLLLSLLFVFFV